MKNIKIEIEYNGKRFHGWQRLPRLKTVQGEIEKTLSEITGENIKIIGSGRTDAGVHALGQVANFRTNCNIPLNILLEILNIKLDKNIKIKNIKEVDNCFHSRYSLKEKTYRYIINNSGNVSPLFNEYEYFVRQKLNIHLMRKAAEYLIGTHDFKAFKTPQNIYKNTVRTIFNINIYNFNDRIYIEITGNGFLYNMVRIIAGTLVDVGLGKIKVNQIPNILASKNREFAGEILPPNGLYLLKVIY